MSLALIVVHVLSKPWSVSRRLRWRVILMESSEKPALETGFVARGQFVGISILTLRQRLWRVGMSH